MQSTWRKCKLDGDDARYAAEIGATAAKQFALVAAAVQARQVAPKEQLSDHNLMLALTDVTSRSDTAIGGRQAYAGIAS